jgi:hydrogenase maturation protease
VVLRIIGIGRRTGGDDGAGPAVIDYLRKNRKTSAIELHEVGEPSALIPLLENATRIVIVDAAINAGNPGTVQIVRPEDIDQNPLFSMSTHGMSVGQAIALARVLAPESVCRDIYLVAIAAQKPQGVVLSLSPEVAAAIEEAAEKARTLAAGNQEN